MSSARLRARKLIDDFGIDDSAILVEHLEDLCFELKAPVQYRKLDGAEARIVAADGRAVITVNSEEGMIERRRFSIGHELGHFFLHSENPAEFNCSRKDMNEWFAKQKAVNQEVEANEFSIELLIPEVLAKPIVEKSKPSIEMIEGLAEKFLMSRSATALRYVELSEEAVAVVFFSKAKGITGMPKKSKYFDEQNFWLPAGPLDKESLAYDLVNGSGGNRMTSVAASAWIDLPDYLDEELIMEQSRYYPGIDRGFSLLWIKDGRLLRN
jgi:Zn-dependent peptidase ImmA (M78 family)